MPSARTIIDVSGDGRDNCNPPKPVDAVRDELVASGATINGLPILDREEAKTLAQWYRDHVIGGQNAFLLPASGFGDFGRAIRAKFILEISFLAQQFRLPTRLEPLEIGFDTFLSTDLDSIVLVSRLGEDEDGMEDSSHRRNRRRPGD